MPRNALTTETSNAVSLPEWVTNWQLGDQVPATADRDRMIAMKQAVEATLAPTNPEAFAVIFQRLFRFYQVFGIKHEVATQIQFFRDALGHMPPDLLELSIKRAIENQTWRTCFLPGDLAEFVVGEMIQRRINLSHIIAIIRDMPDRTNPNDTQD